MNCITPQDMVLPSTVDQFVSLFNDQLSQAPLGNDEYSVVIPYSTSTQNQNDIINWYTQCGWTNVKCIYNGSYSQLFLQRP